MKQEIIFGFLRDVTNEQKTENGDIKHRCDFDKCVLASHGYDVHSRIVHL